MVYVPTNHRAGESISIQCSEIQVVFADTKAVEQAGSLVDRMVIIPFQVSISQITKSCHKSPIFRFTSHTKPPYMICALFMLKIMLSI